MEQFEARVSQFMQRHRMPGAPSHLIVGLSGGADSVALLAALTALGYHCTAAHCNFNLRGAESVRDMHHAERISALLDTDLCVKDFDVASRRAATGESIEMACRELRYGWWDELLDRLGAKAIAVGHHREDSIETFFINLVRGSGLNGLSGIEPRRGHILRPLLDFTRDEIEQYVRRRGLTWVDDSTNAGDDYVRNRIRHYLLPALDAIGPDAQNGVLRSLALLSENKALYRRSVEIRGDRYTDPKTGDIDLRALGADPDGGLLLFEMLRHEGYNRTQTDDMLTAAGRSGGVFVSRTNERHLDHGTLRAPRAARRSAARAVDVSMLRGIIEPINIEITRHHISEFKPERDPRVIYIDECALDGEARWQLRPWQRGDRLEPYGMDGSRLVSDIMAGARLSAAAKASTWLLTRDGCPMWVVGLRASRHFTIGPDTRRYLRLKLND